MNQKEIHLINHLKYNIKYIYLIDGKFVKKRFITNHLLRHEFTGGKFEKSIKAPACCHQGNCHPFCVSAITHLS